MRADDIHIAQGGRRGRANGAVANVRGLAREVGLRAALASYLPGALARAKDTVYARRTELLLVKALQDVDAGRAPAAAPGASPETLGLRVERIRQRHAEELVALRTQPDSWNPGQAANMLEHLHSGYQGFLIRRHERAVGHFWWIDRDIAPRHPHLAEFQVPLGDADAYCFEYYIAPRERGGGVATDALRAMEAHLAGLGYKRVWGTVDPANTAARWLYVAGGWSIAHTVRTARLLGLRTTSVSDAAPSQP